MDINATLKLLQGQTAPLSKEKLPLSNEGNEVPTVNNTQQSTGEEFSTFLTLLTAQIQNQDPLAPLDSTQFVEQLATFTNLELQAKGNNSLELIAALLIRQIELLTPEEETVENSIENIDTAA
ncbi:MAG: hypothetical protein L3J05_00120 [Robiginitomaculum sp.]|nr:hypothetical protein [Robiginitomaculum sp.]